MSILLDTPTTADYDLADSATILWHTMVAAGDVRVVVRVGTVVKPCVALAGVWELFFYVNIGGTGYSIEPAPQQILTSDSTLKLFVSKVSDVSAGTIVGVRLTSPNAGDTEVTVTAEIWHVSGSLPAAVPNATGGLMTFGIGAGQINPDGTGQVPSSNAALATNYTADRAGKLDNIYSDTTHIDSDIIVLTADVAKVYSDTTIIYSDTTIIGSDVVIAVSDTTQIASDLVIEASDVAQLYSDTTIIASDLVQIYSDTATIISDITEFKGTGWTTETLKVIKDAVDTVGNSQQTIENSESQVYNTDTADGSTVVNEES